MNIMDNYCIVIDFVYRITMLFNEVINVLWSVLCDKILLLVIYRFYVFGYSDDIQVIL